MISTADFVFLCNTLIWSMGLGFYVLSHFVIRRHKDAYDVRRSITGALVVGYVCYGYIEIFSDIAGQTDLAPRHWIGLVVGFAFLVSSAWSLPKSLDSRTDQGH